MIVFFPWLHSILLEDAALSNGCKVVSCKWYWCVLFIVLGGCFCGSRFQLLAQVVQEVLEKKAWMIWMMDGTWRIELYPATVESLEMVPCIFWLRGCAWHAILFVASFMLDLGRFPRRHDLLRGCCFLFSLVRPIDQASQAHQFGRSFMSIRPILARFGVEEERAVAFVSSCQLILLFVLRVRIVAAMYVCCM